MSKPTKISTVPTPAAGTRRWLHEELRGLPAGAAVLVLGCDEAFIAPQLLEYSDDVTVLDTSGGQLMQLARRFPEIAFLPHQPGARLPFPHDTFDAVVCCEFLDRVFDPGAVLRDIHRVLTPGGRLLVTVPDHGPMRNVLIALFNWDNHFAPLNPRIRFFTRRTLSRVARSAGFASIQMATSGAVRRVAGSLVPRTLMLRARKGPGIKLAITSSDDARRGPALDEELAFAGRVRAAA
jgi:SAM-dependent methyltransferase